MEHAAIQFIDRSTATCFALLAIGFVGGLVSGSSVRAAPSY